MKSTRAAARAVVGVVASGMLVASSLPALAASHDHPDERRGLAHSAAAAAARQGHPGAPTVDAGDIEFTPGVTLRTGSASSVGLVPEYVDKMSSDIERFLEPTPRHPDHPMYAGATVIAGKDGTVVQHDSAGYALRYASYDAETGEATELPRDQWIPARNDTIYDLASISKLFTSIAAVQLIERGVLDLDAPVVQYVPAFGQHGKDDITIRNLLTHTSGMRPDPQPRLCAYDTSEEQWAAVNATVPLAEPDTRYIYSDLNMMTLQEVIETVTGEGLEDVVSHQITGPLGMADTMYNPPKSLRDRIAATEYQPWTDRGMVWGSVHDENAYCMGGVAGHAGMFSSAHDLAVLAQTLLDGGQYGDTRILGEDWVRQLFTNHNAAFPGNEHGLGFELGQRWYMDGLTTPVTAGHTGYTGPSLVIDPTTHSFVILLCNRVHPTRDWGSNNPSRRAVARDLARALPVEPTVGDDAWYSGLGDLRTASLGLPVDVPAGGGRMTFDLWYDTEGGWDIGVLQASTDDGATWQRVPLSLRADGHRWSTDGRFSGFEGKQWVQARAQLAGDVTNLRWRYTTDTYYEGRGVYVDGVRIWRDGGGILFNGARPADAAQFRPDGFTASAN
ncbi:MAG TPA: serine hydrolase [Segeticoccus sp.]|jgi:CubicO group peptidase (beta-lactamase class C family)|nr:serine hydrolase [Segeticoccus sp.]